MRSRRDFIGCAMFAAAFALAGALPLVGDAGAQEDEEKKGSGKPKEQGEGGEEVSANEDLMREHGVLRRALLVYTLTAPRLRSQPQSVSPAALHQTAVLFRRFGEDYHERRLEEPFIFPAVKGRSSELARYVEILLVQHQRGRQITDFIIAQSGGRKLGAGAGGLADALDSFALMYQEHTAREDTIIFPAWHKSLSAKAYEQMGDKFEDIERQQFGHDGFDDAVKQIAKIEAELGVGDLARFTAAAPPMV